MCSNDNKISEYREDHDYLPELMKFTNKDFLILSLYQEWVRSRYNKPTTYLTLIISSLVLLVATFSLLSSLDRDGMLFILTGSATFLLIVLTFHMLWMNRKSESSEIEKLNAIRDAIEKLSDTK